MAHDVLAAFYNILPVVLAGILFIIVLKKKWLGVLKIPLDLDLRIRNESVFGRNKTWLGLGMMSFCTVFFTAVLSLTSNARTVVPLYDVSVSNLMRAWLVGACYSFGELPNSFIKRRLHIAPGEQANSPAQRLVFKIFDTVDSVIAAGLALFILYDLSLATYMWILILGSGIHAGTDVLMRRISLK